MSTRRPKTSSDVEQVPLKPLIGALLRLPRDYVVNRMHEALERKGYDISLTELSVFMYPGPDGMRPIELARRCNMARQGMNYVLGGLENRGYIERVDGSSGLARVVHLSRRGQDVLVVMRKTVTQIEREWSDYLGEKRFKELTGTLLDLSTWLGQKP